MRLWSKLCKQSMPQRWLDQNLIRARDMHRRCTSDINSFASPSAGSFGTISGRSCTGLEPTAVVESESNKGCLHNINTKRNRGHRYPAQLAASGSDQSSFGPTAGRQQVKEARRIPWFVQQMRNPGSQTVLSTERKEDGIFMKGTAPAAACDTALAANHVDAESESAATN